MADCMDNRGATAGIPSLTPYEAQCELPLIFLVGHKDMDPG